LINQALLCYFYIMEEASKAKLVQKIIQRDGIPALSPLAIRLVELAADDQKGAQDLADIIEKDPALTTRLLKLAGSAFFARPVQVTSIPQAVVLLGFKRVRLMALTLSLRDTFTTSRKHGMDFNHFWKTSLYRALIAQEMALAADTAGLNPDEAFVAGLLLEIGLIMLYTSLSDPEEVFPGGGEPLERVLLWEETRFGIHHREVGGLILQRWRFSEELVACQRYFGDHALAPDTPILCRLVELARRATEVVFGATDTLYELHELARGLLSISKAQMDEILSSSFGKVEELGEQLRIAVDSQQDIITVMEKANQTLARLTASLDSSIEGLVTQVREYDQSLSQLSRAAALHRQETLNNTLDAVAHEIRNPLLSIGGFAQRLARHATEETRAQEYAGIIAQESRRLEQVLQEIVGYSRAYTPTFIQQDLVAVVHEVIEACKELFQEEDIRVVTDFPREAIHIPMDRDGMRNALTQLMKNALKSIDQSGGTLHLSISPGEPEGELTLSISHNGPPMPETVRNLLMDSNLTGKAFDQGLGLPLARKIIEAHRGRIELVQPQPMENTLRLYLPTLVPS